MISNDCTRNYGEVKDVFNDHNDTSVFKKPGTTVRSISSLRNKQNEYMTGEYLKYCMQNQNDFKVVIHRNPFQNTQKVSPDK